MPMTDIIAASSYSEYLCFHNQKKMKSTLKMLVLVSMLAAITGYAQKGIGERNGVVEEAIPIALIEMNGTIEKVKKKI